MKRRRALLGPGAAAAAAVLLALVVPGTGGRFVAAVTNSQNTDGASTRFTCAATFNDSYNRANAYFEYRFASSNATTSDQSTAGNTGTSQGTGPHPTGTAVATTACPNDSGSYYAPDGSTNWISTTNAVGTSPATFSLAIWFQTTAAGGYLEGLNNNQTGTGNAGVTYDRHLYVGADGKVRFGTYSSGYDVVASSVALNDGKWHQAVATMSPTAGMALWIDGVKASSNSAYVSAEPNANGYWRIAQGPLDGWPSAPADFYFAGGLRFAAAYRFVLSDSEIQAEYRNGKPGP